MIDVPPPLTAEEGAAFSSKTAELTRKDLFRAVHLLRQAADDSGLDTMLREVHKAVLFDCYAVDANPDTDATEFDADILRRGGDDD